MDGDAGAEAGMGHVYRSIAYARRMRAEVSDASVRFYMRDFPEGVTKVSEEEFAITVLGERPTRSDFEDAFRKDPFDLLIIDTLGSSHELIEAARKVARAVITIDDLNLPLAETDVVVNGILWGTRLLANPFGRARVYQGVEYIQLREQFAEANARPRIASAKVRTILISTGGADGRGFAFQLMESLRELSFPCSVMLMAGPAYKNVSELKERAQAISGRTRFTVMQNVTDMAQYLLEADVAVITGGTIMFESAACGTPAVLACSYEHQVPQAEWFSARGCAVNLGYFADQVDQQKIAKTIEDLASNQARRQEMSRTGKATVDGRGLERFVSIVQALLS